MTRTTIIPSSLGLALLLNLPGCTPREHTPDERAPAPVDTTAATSPDTSGTVRMDTLTAPDTGVATPPITPPSPAVAPDTPPAGTPPPSNQGAAAQGGRLSQLEYEGWRQYSVNCARCHGQDVLPNPVAANLLVSVGPGGPMAAESEFTKVVSQGRPERGMPAFNSIMSPEQIQAVYAYVKARAEKRIPPGRPAQPGG